MDKEEISFMLKDIAKRLQRLNEWEIGFIVNVEDRFLKGQSLSKKQLDTLDKIYEKATENG